MARETTDMPVRGGFNSTVRNPAGAEQTVRHSGRCLARRARYRRRRGRRRRRAKTVITRSTFMDTAAPGSNLFDHSVPTGGFPVGTGYQYDSAQDMIVLGHAIGRTGRVFTPLFSQEDLKRTVINYFLRSPGELQALPGR